MLRWASRSHDLLEFSSEYTLKGIYRDFIWIEWRLYRDYIGIICIHIYIYIYISLSLSLLSNPLLPTRDDTGIIFPYSLLNTSKMMGSQDLADSGLGLGCRAGIIRVYGFGV